MWKNFILKLVFLAHQDGAQTQSRPKYGEIPFQPIFRIPYRITKIRFYFILLILIRGLALMILVRVVRHNPKMRIMRRTSRSTGYPNRQERYFRLQFWTYILSSQRYWIIQIFIIPNHNLMNAIRSKEYCSINLQQRFCYLSPVPGIPR